MDTYADLTKVVKTVAGTVALIVLIAIPSGFFLIATKYESAKLDMEASRGANVVSEIIYANPDLWKFNEHRLVGVLKQTLSRGDTHNAVITDMQGNTIAALPADIGRPTQSFSIDLTDGEKIVGKITVTHSRRPLLIDTAFSGLFSALLALAIYFVLKILPLRALTTVIERLDESQQSLRKEIQAKGMALSEAKDVGVALRHQALHDALTNLPNRTLFYDRLQQGISIARRDNKMLALIMLDLDQFKAINDTLGHRAGDIVLQQVGTWLQQMLRGSDTIARLGGDEFAILLALVHGREEAVITAQRILETILRPLVLENQTLHIGASLGIVLFPEHGEDPAALLWCADVAMYSAKRAQSGFEFYNVEHDVINARKIALQNDLRAAIEGNQLVLHYQPKIDLVTNRVCSVEALVRWQHPVNGLIFPDEFIPIAEQSGLIRRLTCTVLRMALQQATEWQMKGLALPIAINISGVDLQDSNFSEQVIKIMGEYTVSPTLIEMEITETALMADPLSAIVTIQKMRDIGIVVSIDDFGTGYSSMAYLKKLVVSRIKVDKSFVMDMITSPNDMVIVRSTIELAHNLGMSVVAEGVETEEAMEQLKLLGCDVAQGYHMSRPVPAEKLNEWLEKSRWGLA